MFRFAALEPLGLLVVVACSPGVDPEPSPTATGGAPSVGGSSGFGNAAGIGGAAGNALATGSGGGGGAACSPYVDDAPEVTGTNETGPPPVMTGGAIVDGKYWLTAIKYYGTPQTPQPIAERLDMARGGTYIDDVSRESGIETRVGESFTVNGAAVAFEITCGAYVGTKGTAQYSATPTTFTTLGTTGTLQFYSKK